MCGESTGQSVIANVVKLEADCPVAGAEITNELLDYCKAYFSKNREFKGLNIRNIKGSYKIVLKKLLKLVPKL